MRLIKANAIIAVIILSFSTINAIDFSKGILHDITRDQMEKRVGPIPEQNLTPDEIKAIEEYRFDADTFKVLVIPVDWIDRNGTASRATLDSFMFSRNVWPGGSVADYYYETSYGQLIMVGEVLDWYTDGLYPGAGYDFEDVFPALDPTVDYSQFDGNGDNVVDAVVFLRAGTGEEDSQNPSDIWSYAFSYSPGGGPGPFDGMRMSRWNTSPEMKPLRDSLAPIVFSGLSELNGIRVFAHELGHNFGLPDLYDYNDKLVTSSYDTPNDNNDHPLVDWCVMGYYGYGILAIGSRTPSHFCGWSKKELGWIEPIEIYGTVNDLVIYDIETHQDSSLYKIYIDHTGEEYFLLEYRNPQSTGLFDKYDSDFSCWFWPDLTYGNDPMKRGLLITHIDDDVSYGNNGTPVYPNYQVIVEDAGYNPGMNQFSNPEGHVTDSAEWWYPWETRKGALFTSEVAGKEEFSPSSTPNSNSYNSGATGVVITVDSIVGDKLYASINNPNLFDADADGSRDWEDNCPNKFNPNQDDSDFDSVGDSCDNCITIANTNQADPDNDLIGSVCDNCPNHFNPLQEDSDNDNIGDVCCCTNGTGDTNGDGNDANILDLNYIVNYIFRVGSDTECFGEGDVNADGNSMNILDLNYLVNYIFRTGPSMPSCL